MSTHGNTRYPKATADEIHALRIVVEHSAMNTRVSDEKMVALIEIAADYVQRIIDHWNEDQRTR